MRQVAQSLQRRPQECIAAVAFVQKTQLLLQRESILFNAFPQCRDLTADRQFISLPLRADSGIQRDTQCLVHDVRHSFQWGPMSSTVRTIRPVTMGDSGWQPYGAGATPAQMPGPRVGPPAG